MTRFGVLLVLVISGGLLAGCGPPSPTRLDVDVLLQYDGQTIDCVATARDGTQLTDLRFFVADVATLTPATSASTHVQLIDFENAAAACINGSAATSTRLRLSVPSADFQGLAFTLGVPFDSNHQDPLRATAPLNLPAMHWHWRSGYKFLRAGIVKNDTRWHVHLGSTGCEGAITQVTGCQRPNRARIELPNWRPGDAIVMDLDQLLHGVKIDRQTAAHCQAQVDNPACRAIAENLGLNPETGVTENAQRVFRVLAR